MTKNMLKKFRIVFLSVMISWGVAVFVRFLMPRTLGPNVLGYYATAEAYAAISAVFVSWGFGSWISIRLKEVGTDWSKNVQTIFQVQILTAFCVLSASVAIGWVLGETTEVIILLSLLLSGMAGTQIAETATRVVEADERFAAVARISNPLRVITGAISASWLGCVLLFSINPIWGALGVGMSLLTGELVRATLILRLAGISLFVPCNWLSVKNVLRDSFGLFVIASTPVIFGRIPILLLAKVPSYESVLPNSSVEVGIYSAAMSLTFPLGVLVLGIQRVLLPNLSASHHKGREEFSKAFSMGALVVMLFVGLGISLLIMLGNIFVDVLFGYEFRYCKPVLAITMATVVLQYASLLLITGASAWRLEKVAVLASFISFPVNVSFIIIAFHFGIFKTGAYTVAISCLLYEIMVMAILYSKVTNIFTPSFQSKAGFCVAACLTSLAVVVSWMMEGIPHVVQIGIAMTIVAVSGLCIAIGFRNSLREVMHSWTANS